MVVLAVSICTKNGKALLSRQFSEMTKSRIEGLLAAFPKLIGTGKQHTFIETENIRYVYQPLESLYLILITNKNSNILEDLETLHLLAKLIPEYSSFDESDILKNAFELIFTFDEVIAMGYKERVTLQQVKLYISMESHEEQRAKMELAIKQKEAKMQATKKIQELDKKRQMGGFENPYSSSGGYSGGGRGGNEGYGSSSPSQSSSHYSSDQKRENITSPPATSNKIPGKEGMKLSKAGTKKSAIAQVLKEEKIVEKVEEAEALLESNSPILQSSAPAVVQEGVHVTIQEDFLAQVENDGGVQNIDIKGGLSVTVNDNSLGRVRVQINQGPSSKLFQFITHPQIDKAAFSESTLKLKSGVSAFPGGGILKWRCKTTDDSVIPIKVNCWPSPSKDNTVVNLEYESLANFDLKNVVIMIPNPLGVVPVINNFSGLYEYDSKNKVVMWKIPIIDDTNRQGSMEFSVKGSSSNFFPVKISFSSTKTICDIDVSNVFIEESSAPTKFSTESNLTVDTYEIN
eukprot:gene8526-10481_t